MKKFNLIIILTLLIVTLSSITYAEPFCMTLYDYNYPYQYIGIMWNEVYRQDNFCVGSDLFLNYCDQTINVVSQYGISCQYGCSIINNYAQCNAEQTTTTTTTTSTTTTTTRINSTSIHKWK